MNATWPGRSLLLQLHGRTVEMLLSEPATRIEGPLEEVLTILFEMTYRTLNAEMDSDTADGLAMKSLVRVHTALADAGLVVRQVNP